MLADTTSFARRAWTAGALAAGFAFAAWSGCGGKAVVDDGTAGGGGGSGTTTTSSTSTWTTTTSSTCPPASEPGCCHGDGACCSCVAKVCGSGPMGDDPGVQELTACVCQAGVCADACAHACKADGIDPTCLPCVDEAVQSTCEQQYLMCLGD